MPGYEKHIKQSVDSVLELYDYILKEIVKRKIHRNNKFKGVYNTQEI
jgi:hypothetical protein